MVEQANKVIQKIQDCMKTAQNWQKGYADRQHRPFEFKVGDHVFLKVTQLKGILRFDKKKGQLSP